MRRIEFDKLNSHFTKSERAYVTKDSENDQAPSALAQIDKEPVDHGQQMISFERNSCTCKSDDNSGAKITLQKLNLLTYMIINYCLSDNVNGFRRWFKKCYKNHGRYSEYRRFSGLLVGHPV